MSTFLNALRSGRVLLMDGAMGTELIRAGLKPGENSAAWNLLHPDRVRAVHRAYHKAGAEVLLTNTFMGMAFSLDDIPLAGQQYVHLGVCSIACKLIGRPAESRFRVISLGPATDLSGREYNQARRFYGYWKGADAVLLETCSSPRVRYAVRNVLYPFSWNKPIPPVLLSLSFARNAGGEIHTQSGHSPEWFANRAREWGVVALGVNCGKDIGMDDIIEIIRRYRKVTDLPLFARPNAGTPTKKGKRWVYPLTPKQMAARLPELLEAGVCMVGGCCGTTPAHIAAMRPVIDAWNAGRR